MSFCTVSQVVRFALLLSVYVVQFALDDDDDDDDDKDNDDDDDDDDDDEDDDDFFRHCAEQKRLTHLHA